MSAPAKPHTPLPVLRNVRCKQPWNPKSEAYRLFRKRRNLIRLVASNLLLILAFQFFGISGRYAESFQSAPVGDWFHDLIPLMNLNFLVSYGYPLFILLLSLFFVIEEPKNLNAFVLMMALCMILRGLFYSMTHLGAPAARLDDYTNIGGASSLNFTQDLFFSGHVAIPFLGFLIAQNRRAKALSLTTSILMAFGVLAMHTHYSIDVFGAYFIAFGLYYAINKYLGRYIATD